MFLQKLNAQTQNPISGRPQCARKPNSRSKWSRRTEQDARGNSTCSTQQTLQHTGAATGTGSIHFTWHARVRNKYICNHDCGPSKRRIRSIMEPLPPVGATGGPASAANCSVPSASACARCMHGVERSWQLLTPCPQAAGRRQAKDRNQSIVRAVRWSAPSGRTRMHCPRSVERQSCLRAPQTAWLLPRRQHYPGGAQAPLPPRSSAALQPRRALEACGLDPAATCAMIGSLYVLSARSGYCVAASTGVHDDSVREQQSAAHRLASGRRRRAARQQLRSRVARCLDLRLCLRLLLRQRCSWVSGRQGGAVA